MSKIVVVTKYPRLAEYLKKRGIVPQDAAMLPRANTEDVKGAHVYGVVPLWLASFADRVTEYALMAPREVDPNNLSVEDIDHYLRTPITYRVERLEGPNE